MAYLYITLGIDPEKILPGTSHKTQSELWDSDGIWTYVEYHAERRTTEEVTIIYKVFVDWTRTLPKSSEGMRKYKRLKADFGNNPLKTVEENIKLEKPSCSGISGNDMSSSCDGYDLRPMSIDPKYATAYAAKDAYERIITRWLKRHKEQITTLISDIISISQGAAEGKAGSYAKTAEEMMASAKGMKEYAEMNKLMSQLQRSILSLKKDLEPFTQALEQANKESSHFFQNAKAVGTDGGSLSRQISQAEYASKLVNEIDRMIYQPVKPATPRRVSKNPPPEVKTQIESSLKSSAKNAVNEVSGTTRNGTRIASSGEMSFVETTQALNKSSVQLKSLGETAQESSLVFSQASKWLKRAGYVGIALQAGCVLLNGLFVLLADEGDERNSAIQTFTDSAGSFGISLGLYFGAAAIGGPVGLAIGLGLAAIDIILLCTTGKSSGDLLWKFVKYVYNAAGGRTHVVVSIIQPIRF